MSGARSPVHRACSFPPREGGKLAAPCVRGCARPGPCHGVWLLFAGLAFIRVPAGPRGEPSRFPALIRCPAFTWPPSVLGAPEIGRAQGPSSLPAWGPALGAAARRLGDLCLQGPDRPPEGGRGDHTGHQRAAEARLSQCGGWGGLGAGSACGCEHVCVCLCVSVCVHTCACLSVST